MPPNLGNAGLLCRILDEKVPPSPSGNFLASKKSGYPWALCGAPVTLTPIHALPPPQGQPEEAGMVRLVCGHNNWIAVAYTQFLVCYRFSGSGEVGGLSPGPGKGLK